MIPNEAPESKKKHQTLQHSRGEKDFEVCSLPVAQRANAHQVAALHYAAPRKSVAWPTSAAKGWSPFWSFFQERRERLARRARSHHLGFRRVLAVSGCKRRGDEANQEPASFRRRKA